MSLTTTKREPGQVLKRVASPLWRAVNSPAAKWFVVALPLLWLLCFLAFPLLEIFQISFTTQARSVNPLFFWGENGFGTNFNFDAYFGMLYDPVWQEWSPGYFAVPFWRSLRLASVSTLIMLFFAYPMAYWIATSSPRRQLVLLILVLLPFWTPSLLRIYSLIGLMRGDGLINEGLQLLRFVDQPLRLRGSDFAIYFGMYITYLPLMILPLYAALSRMDRSLHEAATDLGAGGFTVFRTIIFPLSLPGVIAGCILVFVPAFGEYMVPTLLGSPDHKMMGAKIWDVYAKEKFLPGASAMAVILMTVLVLPVVIYQLRSDSQGESSHQKPQEAS